MSISHQPTPASAHLSLSVDDPVGACRVETRQGPPCQTRHVTPYIHCTVSSDCTGSVIRPVVHTLSLARYIVLLCIPVVCNTVVCIWQGPARSLARSPVCLSEGLRLPRSACAPAVFLELKPRQHTPMTWPVVWCITHSPCQSDMLRRCRVCVCLTGREGCSWSESQAAHTSG